MVTGAPRSRGFLLALLSLAGFCVVFNNLIVAPLLPELADDLDVRVAVAGLSVTGYAITAAVIAIGAGPLIDRLGRRPVVVASVATLALGTALSAVAPTFPLFMVSRAIAGLGAASLMPAVFAFVGDSYGYHERGRAIGVVMAANSCASIAGVPIGTVVGDFVSWRVTFAALGLLTFLIAVLLARGLPREPRAPAAGPTGLPAIRSILGYGPAAATLVTLFLSTASWFVMSTYVAAFYHEVHDLPGWALGGVTMAAGVGILLGGTLGGRLADRVGKRRIIIAAALVTAALAPIETGLTVSVVLAAVVLVALGAAQGARFAGTQAILTELTPERRGTAMALGTTFQQFGIVAGSAAGSLVLSTSGYGALGLVSTAFSAVGLVLVARFVDDRRLGGEARRLEPLAEPAHEPV